MTALPYRWYAPPDPAQRSHAFVEGKHRSVCTRERRDMAGVLWSTRNAQGALRCWQCIRVVRLGRLAEVTV